MGNREGVCADYYISTSMTEETARAIFAIMP